jgi:hypothetical protein
VSITKQGTTKIVAASGGVATVVFDSTPALGDLIVIEAFAATTGPTMGVSGFSNGGQAPNSAGNRFAYQFFKIAGGSETNSYGVNVSGVNNGVIGRVFRATNGFKSAAECIATVNSGGAATTMTADPAGVPSNASSVEISTFNSGSSSSTSATLAFDGGSTQAYDTHQAGRAFSGFKIETSAPADTKAVWASLASSSSHCAAIAVFVENSGDASQSASDTGSGADAKTLSATFARTESGSGADAKTLATSFARSESGAGVDAKTLAVSAARVDIGSGVEGAGAVVAAFARAEIATGTDASSISIALGRIDSASATDASLLGAALARGDLGTAVDVRTLLASLARVDVGHGIDTASATLPNVTNKAANDVGHGVEEAVFIVFLIFDTDQGSSTERAVSLQYLRAQRHMHGSKIRRANSVVPSMRRRT